MSALASSPVTTANTPARARARLVSMRAMRACGCGLRSTAACSIPGSFTSSVYVARPARSFGSSRRGTSLPIQRRCAMAMAISSASRRGCGHARRGQPDRVDDALVSGAAAQIGRDRLADLLLARRGMVPEQLVREHQHARRAEAALEPLRLAERFL